MSSPFPPRPRVVAIVPMRHESERVPGKNYRPFAGRPLYHHIVSALLACPPVAEVLIDTDSPAIMADAAQHFPQARVLERPAHLRDGATPMNDVLLNVVRQAPADLYLQTHSTNPLLRAATIQSAIERLVAPTRSTTACLPSRGSRADSGITLPGRSTITRPSCCAPRICRRSTRRTRTSTCSPAPPWSSATTAWASDRCSSRWSAWRPGTSTKRPTFASPS